MSRTNNPYFQTCEICKFDIPREQFGDTEVISSVCNNCLARWKVNAKILSKFVEWSKTCKKYLDNRGHLASLLFSNYSAPAVEKAVLASFVNFESRKTLVDSLVELMGDGGDTLLLAECMEELNQLQDETK